MAKYLKQKLIKMHKGLIKTIEYGNIIDKKSEFSLKSIEHCRLSENQLEYLRRYYKRQTKFIRKRRKRKLSIIFRILVKCNYTISKKPLEIRMGKGKGAIDKVVARVRSGKLLLNSKGFLGTQNTLGLNSLIPIIFLNKKISDLIFFKIIKKVSKKFACKTKCYSKLNNYV